MDRRFYRSVLAVAIAAVLFPGVAMSDTPDENSVIWDGGSEGTLRQDAIYEQRGGNENGPMEMTVKNYHLIDFQNGGQFSSLWVKGAISLAGGNGDGKYPEAYQPYGDLKLSVLDSTLKGVMGSQQWMGAYARSDTEGATTAIISNSLMDITATSDVEWTMGAAIYAETKGELSHSSVTLNEGSDINVTTTGTHFESGLNAGVLAYASKGSASVIANENTAMTTSGFGTDGIKIFSREESLVMNKGSINNVGEEGRGIHSHGEAGGKGKISVINGDTGTINMDGKNSWGIFAFNFGSGGMEVYNSGKITLSEASDNSIGIYIENYIPPEYSADEVKLSAVNAGEVVTGGNASKGIAISGGLDSGSIAAGNTGSIMLHGENSVGIEARTWHSHDDASGKTNVGVYNSGTITLGDQASDSMAIALENYAVQGNARIVNDGTIITQGANANAIHGVTGQLMQVVNNGKVVTADGNGIDVESYQGIAQVQNHGDILVHSRSEDPSYGIHATGGAGAEVHYAKGTLQVSGQNSVAIAAGGGGENKIQLDSGTHVDASKGLGGLLVAGSGTGHVAINQGAAVTGGGRDGFGVKYSGSMTRDAGASQFTLDNAGSIGALSDKAIAIDNAAGTQVTLNNYGDITGYLTANSGDITLNNHHALNLRHFADATGDQQRDTKQVAIMQFGEDDNHVNNADGAVIQLAGVSGHSGTDTTGQFTAQGTKSITADGIGQGQMLNVNSFSNAGVLNLAVNQLAGDILAITGNGSLAGQSVHDGGSVTSGGGQFVSNGGTLVLDTVLNEGGSASQSDVLVVDNASQGSAATTIVINKVGGSGSLTQQDGIQVVNVLGEANREAFTLARSPLKAGAYEYTLEQGSLSNPANQSFYLRTGEAQINPDVGGYLANQTMATGLFMHSLHDRLGEPQFTQRYKGDERVVPGLWLRAVAGNTKGDAANRALSQDINSRVMHLGGDITRWDSDNGDRYHLGLMGAYGRADTVSKSKKTGSSSRSKVDGYGVGAYLTWYNKAGQMEGWYADLWGMYNRFENTADSAKDYDSKSWVLSLESGHASTLKPFEAWRWMIEPQAQVSYAHYSADKITDGNGMTVGNGDANGVSTRLGLRTYLQPTAPKDDARFQPFLTVNWLWSDAGNSMDFNGATFSSDMPKNRFEGKLGLQTEVRKDVHVYGQISGQIGENSYSHKAAQLGLRYNF